MRCLLAYADGEYVRSTAASNARARALYEAALDLVRSADAAPQTGPDVPFPANPVHGSLQTYATTSLDKIHHGLNIAATSCRTRRTGSSVLPSQYRYAVLIERARTWSAPPPSSRRPSSPRRAGRRQRLCRAQAAHDLDVARAMIGQADLKVAAAGIGVQQANSQTRTRRDRGDHFGSLLAAGPNDHEREQLFDLEAARDLAAAGGIFTGLGSSPEEPARRARRGLSGLSQAAALDAQIEATQASFERQQEELAAAAEPGRQGHRDRSGTDRAGRRPAEDRGAGTRDRRDAARPRRGHRRIPGHQVHQHRAVRVDERRARTRCTPTSCGRPPRWPGSPRPSWRSNARSRTSA